MPGMTQLQLFDLPVRPPSTACVYFARRKGALKIGYSADVERRMNELGAKLVAAMPGDRSTEAWLHRRFAASRIGNEWFEPSPDLLAFIHRLRPLASRWGADWPG